MASFREEHEPRGDHGHLISEAIDKDNASKWRVKYPPAVDYVKVALSKAQAAFKEEFKDVDMDTRLWSVTKDD